MNLRRKKSRKSQAADLLGNYLKIEAAGKAAKGAKKAAKGTAAYKVAKKRAGRAARAGDRRRNRRRRGHRRAGRREDTRRGKDEPEKDELRRDVTIRVAPPRRGLSTDSGPEDQTEARALRVAHRGPAAVRGIHRISRSSPPSSRARSKPASTSST